MNGLAIGAVVLAVVTVIELRERRRRRRVATASWWPWLIGAIERDVDTGAADLPTAAVRAFLGGPPALRSAAERAIRATGTADPISTVSALRDEMGTPAADRVLGTVGDLHRRDAPADTALAWARADAAMAALRDEDQAAEAVLGTAARWMLLLALVAPVGAGRLAGAVGLAVAAAAVALWWATGRWLHARPASEGARRHAGRIAPVTRAAGPAAALIRRMPGGGGGSPTGGPDRSAPENAADATLVGRLRPHVRRHFDHPGERWWAPRPARRWHATIATRARSEELSALCDRMAVLLDAGDGFAEAATRAARGGQGVVADELHAVAKAVRSGEPPATAVSTWARRVGSAQLGALAADLRRATSADDVVAALRHHAGACGLAAHRQQVRSVRRRARALWLLAAAAVAAVVVSM